MQITSLEAGRPATVYVVDDDAAVRDSVKVLLETHGFEVEVYASCADFLDALGERRDGCLLLDLNLPAMDGLTFMARFGRRLEGLPVVLTTAQGDEATRARAFAAGAVAVLEKPFHEDDLVTAVAGVLGRPAARPR